jgi:hypothetical protein
MAYLPMLAVGGTQVTVAEYFRAVETNNCCFRLRPSFRPSGTNPKARVCRTRGMQTSHPDLSRCESAEQACAYAAQILPESEVAAAEAHIASCPDCQRELEALRPVVDRFVSWPMDVLRPPTSLQGRLALRIAEETGKQPVPPPAPQWSEPEWEQVAPGIECKLLAADTERHRVSMVTIIPSSQDGAFDPDAVRAISLALDEVCRTLQIDVDEHARETMAIRILELARRGERDPQRLRDRVLREFRPPAPSGRAE